MNSVCALPVLNNLDGGGPLPVFAKSDIAIAQGAKMLHIRDVAAKLGLGCDQRVTLGLIREPGPRLKFAEMWHLC